MKYELFAYLRHLQDFPSMLALDLGDWLNYGERKYGEMYTQAIDELDYTKQALKDAKWVSAQVEKSRRRDNLSFSHHREVAPLEPDEQEEWSGRAGGILAPS